MSSRDLNDYQKQYQEQPYERFQVNFRKRKIFEILSHYSHDTMLEIGCGLSSIFNDIKSYKKLYVVEPAEDFYNKAVADRKQLQLEESVVLIKDTMEGAVGKLAGVNFDLVLLSSLLHEIADSKTLLKTIYDVAGPKTIIHVNVPNARSFHRLLAVEMGLIKSEFQRSDSNIQFQQHLIFDEGSLKKLVEDNGFKIVGSGSYSLKPFTHRQMEDMIQAGLITEAMLNGFYNMEKYLAGLGSEIYVNMVKA